MNKIEYEIPIMLEKLQALHRRLPTTHGKFPFIEEELFKQQAGYNGVVATKYFFHLIPHNHILIDIRLTNDGIHFFQMDILLLCQNYILILEVKNIAGTLFFDTLLHQCIRILHDKEEGFPCPILQVQRQRLQLIDWLQKQKIPRIPIIPLVAISNSSTIIKSNSNDISKKVIHAGTIPAIIQQLDKMYPREVISLKELKALKRTLLKQNQPFNVDILQKYEIAKDCIKSGVQCPGCMYLPIVRVQGEWLCPKCKSTSVNAHIISLKDYALLISNNITNQHLRTFLHLNSRYTATRIIGSMNLKSVGGENSRKYQLDYS